MLDHNLAGTGAWWIQDQRVKAAGPLVQDPLNAPVHNFHLGLTVQVLAGVATGARGALYGKNRTSDSDGVRERCRKQPGTGVEIGNCSAGL